jgi:hypothetical protein
MNAPGFYQVLKHIDLDVLRACRIMYRACTCDPTAASKFGASSLGRAADPTPECRWLAADFCVEIIIGHWWLCLHRNMQASQMMWRTLHADAFCLARDPQRAILTGQPLDVRCSSLTAFSRGWPVQCLVLVVRRPEVRVPTWTFKRLFASHHRASALESTKARFRFSTFWIISTSVLP